MPGPQLQNIPKFARRMFIAPPGFTYVQGDYERAEAMHVAFDSQEEELISIFEDPSRDLYSEVASDSLRKSISKKDKEREIFKRCIHAAHYGMGYSKAVQVLRLHGIYIRDINIPELTLDELIDRNPKFRRFYREDPYRARGSFRRLSSDDRKAGFILESYHNRFKGIRVWQDGIESQVRANRTLIDPHGRRRIFLGRMDDDLIRKALSYKPQATVVGMTNRALRILDNEGYEVILQVHDNIGMYIESDRLDEGARAIQRAMHCPLDIHGRVMIIRTEIQCGPSWGAIDGWQPHSGKAAIG